MSRLQTLTYGCLTPTRRMSWLRQNDYRSTKKPLIVKQILLQGRSLQQIAHLAVNCLESHVLCLSEFD